MKNRLRELENEMANPNQNLERVLQKYGRLQEKYIALGGYELEEKFKKICSGFKFDDDFLKKEYNTLSGGEKVQLKGKNGSGKSTLIKIILGKDNDFSGEIKINPSVKIGYIPQEIKFQNESDTILEYFLKNFGGSETQARTILARYMFYGENVFKRMKELSGGERVRLLIAELVIKQTNFLILDEPTNHLDISTREILEDNLKAYSGTILFVSHDRYFARNIAEREIEL
mgnify:FL=1